MTAAQTWAFSGFFEFSQICNDHILLCGAYCGTPIYKPMVTYIHYIGLHTQSKWPKAKSYRSLSHGNASCGGGGMHKTMYTLCGALCDTRSNTVYIITFSCILHTWMRLHADIRLHTQSTWPRLNAQWPSFHREVLYGGGGFPNSAYACKKSIVVPAPQDLWKTEDLISVSWKK